jgi:hypothetical protein
MPTARTTDPDSWQDWRRTEEAHSPLSRTQAQMTAAVDDPSLRCLKPKQGGRGLEERFGR